MSQDFFKILLHSYSLALNEATVNGESVFLTHRCSFLFCLPVLHSFLFFFPVTYFPVIFNSLIFPPFFGTVPTVPPGNVQVEPVNSTTIRFTWSAPSPQFINGINQGYKVSGTHLSTSAL